MLALLLSLGAVLCFANEKWQSKGRILTILSCGLVAVASVYLLVLILNNRFDISYVANYSARELPLVYKVSAFWAGQQGSFLLWLLIHAGAGLFLLLKRALPVPGMAVYMALQALLTVLVLAKSPFVPNTNVVENGIGLNPLLQDPWMAVHPPIIFVGYALLAVPFVYGAAAL
ncbi:MAG: cytochrome c biogenesis protein CcsA, partial [Selenomonas sp.]|nr:cytochrome c biogenesis protein CcsA [Selenomonas sp.]